MIWRWRANGDSVPGSLVTLYDHSLLGGSGLLFSPFISMMLKMLRNGDDYLIDWLMVIIDRSCSNCPAWFLVVGSWRGFLCLAAYDPFGLMILLTILLRMMDGGWWWWWWIRWWCLLSSFLIDTSFFPILFFSFPRFVSASRMSQEAYQFATNQTSPNKRPPLQAQRHPSIITIWLDPELSPFPSFPLLSLLFP